MQAVQDLFRLLDQDRNGALDFHEVTALFQQLAPQQSAESAQNAAVEALLMSDKNTDTKLSKAEFAELLSKVADLSGLPLDEAAQRLLTATQQQQKQQQQEQPPPPPPADKLEQVLHGGAAAPAEAAAAPPPPAASAPSAAVTAAVADSQLQSLFALWDKAGDGRISFSELCHGLSKMGQPVKHKKDITALITEAGGVLAAHDSDGDRQLDLAEFSSFMRHFMAAAGYTLHEVIDDLITMAQTKPDNEKLQKVLAAAEPHIHKMLSQD